MMTPESIGLTCRLGPESLERMGATVGSSTVTATLLRLPLETETVTGLLAVPSGSIAFWMPKPAKSIHACKLYVPGGTPWMPNLEFGSRALVPRIEQSLQLVGCKRMKTRFCCCRGNLPAYVSCPETVYPKAALKLTLARSPLFTVM